MLTLFRAFAKSKLAVAILFMIILAFLMEGASDVFRGVAGGGMFQVGDRSLSEREVNRELENTIDSFREEQKRAPTAEEKSRMAASIIDREMTILRVLAYADSAKLDAGARAVELALDTPDYNDGLGRQDPMRVAQQAQRFRMTSEQFKQYIRRQLTLQYVDTGVRAGLHVPEVLSKTQADYYAEQRMISVARFTETSVPEPKAPTEAELRDFYNKNLSRYAQPERRIISILSYGPSDFTDKAEVKDIEVKAQYDQRLKEFSTPETREVLQVTSPDRKVIQAIIDARKGGATLDAAMKSNPGAVLSSKTGQQGMFGIEDVDKAVFAVPVGQIMGPGEAEGAFHAFEVKTIVAGQATPFEQVEETLRTEMATRAASRLYDGTRESFYDLQAGGSTLEELAESVGAPIVTVEGVDATGRNAAGQSNETFVAHKEALAEAFKLNVGQLTEPAETETDRVILRVDAVKAAYTKTFDEVKADLTPLYLATKKVEAAQEIARGVVAAVKGGKTFEKASADAKLAYQRLPTPIQRQMQGPDPKLLSYAFSLKAGEVGTVTGTDGAPWVIQVDSIAEATPEQRQQVAMMVAQQVNQQVGDDMFMAFLTAATRPLNEKKNEKAIQAYLAALAKEETGTR